MGKRLKQSRNENVRANGNEPTLSPDAGIKRVIRYLSRMPAKIKTVKNPELYLHSRGH